MKRRDSTSAEDTSLSGAPEPDEGDEWLAAFLEPQSGLHDAPFPGLVVDGKYRLGSLLGEGGMGWVFEAARLDDEKQVALKYLKPGLVSHSWARRFLREARALGRLDHPNIIRLYDVGGAEPNLYLVMERLEGETLRSFLERGTPSLAATTDIMLAVMAGVAEAHRHGIIHCDLKPENIMLAKLPDGTRDQPKVLDFGLSRISRATRLGETSSTSLIIAAGTPRYMPLEQLRGEPPEAPVDVYALGVILYEMLTGRRPYEARTREDLIIKIATEPPQPLGLNDARFGSALEAISAKALARDPTRRFPSVTDFAREFQAVMVARESGLSLKPSPPVAGSASRRVVLALAGILLGGCALVWLLTRPPAQSASVAPVAPKVAVPANDRLAPIASSHAIADTTMPVPAAPASAAPSAAPSTPVRTRVLHRVRAEPSATSEQHAVPRTRSDERTLQLRREDF